MDSEDLTWVSLNGKVALITGINSSIGVATAKQSVDESAQRGATRPRDFVFGDNRHTVFVTPAERFRFVIIGGGRRRSSRTTP